MSGGRIEKCTGHHLEDARPVATGLVRYVQRDGAEVLSAPLCDRHQAEWCTTLRAVEQRWMIREVYAVPLDYRERATPTRTACPDAVRNGQPARCDSAECEACP